MVLLVSLSLWAASLDVSQTLELSARLLVDGNRARAAVLLEGVDAADVAEQDRARFFELRSILFEDLAAAKNAFALTDDGAPERVPRARRVVVLALKSESSSCRSARDSRNLEDIEDALKLIKDQELLARVHLARCQVAKALDIYQRTPALRSQEVSLLIDLGLYSLAARRAMSLEEKNRRRAIRALSRARAPKEAARLSLGGAAELSAESALAHRASDQPRAAARRMREAARLDARFLADAAELSRLAEQPVTARAIARAIPESPAQLRMRFSILMARERFSRAASLGPRLRRAGLVDDPEIAFALAFAHARTENKDRARAILDTVTDARFTSRVLDLRADLSQ